MSTSPAATLPASELRLRSRDLACQLARLATTASVLAAVRKSLDLPVTSLDSLFASARTEVLEARSDLTAGAFDHAVEVLDRLAARSATALEQLIEADRDLTARDLGDYLDKVELSDDVLRRLIEFYARDGARTRYARGKVQRLTDRLDLFQAEPAGAEASCATTTPKMAKSDDLDLTHPEAAALIESHRQELRRGSDRQLFETMEIRLAQADAADPHAACLAEAAACRGAIASLLARQGDLEGASGQPIPTGLAEGLRAFSEAADASLQLAYQESLAGDDGRAAQVLARAKRRLAEQCLGLTAAAGVAGELGVNGSAVDRRLPPGLTSVWSTSEFQLEGLRDRRPAARDQPHTAANPWRLGRPRPWAVATLAVAVSLAVVFHGLRFARAEFRPSPPRVDLGSLGSAVAVSSTLIVTDSMATDVEQSLMEAWPLAAQDGFVRLIVLDRGLPSAYMTRYTVETFPAAP